MQKPLLECVPNFSEGKNVHVINEIANAIQSTPNVHLLDIDPSPGANRTVYTFAGKPECVIDAAYNAAKIASQLIDMTKQFGAHPRIGAMDVCPFIPLANFTKNETVKLVSDAAKKIGTDLKIPIFLYEENQINEHRKSLPQIRKGQYEHLNEKLTEAGWHPDYGPLTLNSKTGASVIGTRGALVAFNISLETQNLDLAKKIASAMRSSNFKSNDRLTHLRAIAWKMDDYNHVQVSFNLLNYKITSLLDVWLKCNELAQVHATKVIGSELIGLIPEQCLLEVSSYLNLKNQAKEYQINQSIEFLKLNQLKQFDPKIKILEYNLQQYYTTPIDWNILCV